MAAVQLGASTLLLHIGPHKTGTTAVQGAFHLARERLGAEGVIYPGRGRQPLWPILAVTGQPALLGEPHPEISYWENLVREISAAGHQRVVLSSEFFAEADDAVARRVVADLGGPRVYIVVTLRCLTRILPSQWQQYLQNGFHFGYLEWLDGILSDPPRTPTPGFWRRHRHDEFVTRWAAAAGPEHLTVIVVDESDRLMLLRVFETMLGLPAAFLVPEERAVNRSLIVAEAELIRRLNEEFSRRESKPPPGPRSARSSPAGRAAGASRRSCATWTPGAWRRRWRNAAGNGSAGFCPDKLAHLTVEKAGAVSRQIPSEPGRRV